MKIIRGKQPGAKKVVVYGPEGIGKSTFASRFPDPVFIDMEGSTKDMDVARTETPTSWTMLLEQIQYVKTYPDICRTLVIDTIDWAERVCIEHVCALHRKNGIEDFGYGNGYTYTGEEFGRFLNKLSEVIEAGVHVVLTAHAQIKRFDQPDEMGSYDRWELKLGKKTTSQTSPLVKEWADMLLFANYKTHTVALDDKGKKRKAQGGHRVMYTSHHPCWDAKNRYGLPEEMAFDYASIASIIEPAGEKSPEQPEVRQPESETKPEQPKAEQPRLEQKSAEPEQKQPETKETKQPEPKQETSEALAADAGQAIPENDPNSAFHIDERVPKALRDLMIANTVFEEEVQSVCEAKGYVPIGTRLWEYNNVNPGIIDGLLVASWDQVFQAIKEVRDKEELPFD